VNVLDALGGKSDVLVRLDFESYWAKDFSLRKLTTEAYVRDPRFEVLGVGVKWADQPTVWLEEWDFREWAARVDWSRVTLCAHHAQFDGLVAAHHYGIRPRFWLDTMSMARALHGPFNVALEKLAVKYGIGHKGKELENTKGKHRQDFTPEEWEAFGRYCITDVDLTDALLWRMLPGFPVEELWLIDTTIRMFTEPVLRADFAVLTKALEEERQKKTALLERIGATRELLSSNDKFSELLRRLGETPPMKPGKRGQIFAFAKTDPGMQTLLEHERDDVRFLAEARLAVKSTIVETRTERLIGCARRGPVPFYLKYSGAHTHRWSGGDKMNPQNFNRGGSLRAAILAPPGHKLAVADSGQIEARKVAWVARQLSLLETFRRNDALGKKGDFYSDEGSRFFGRKLSKEDTPQERQISKALLLGLGFGMGVFKCAGELLKGMLGTDPVQFTDEHARRFNVSPAAFEQRVYGQDVTCGEKVQEMIDHGARLPYAALLTHCAVTDHFVRLYRTTNTRVSGLWKAMESLLGVMADPTDDRGQVRSTFGCLKVVRHGLVKPNGLTLHYPGLKRTARGYVYLGGKGGREWVKVYGGLLTENVVQSLARDVVAEQALWIRAAGYRIATTTHDEIVCVVPEEQATECLAFMLARMKIPPAWCADLPLNASGGVAVSYGAVK
jgi:DNA polymerase